jgi:hypothetical protein
MTTSIVCASSSEIAKGKKLNRITRPGGTQIRVLDLPARVGKALRGGSEPWSGVAHGGGWAPGLAVLRPPRQQLAVRFRAEAGDKHRYEGAGGLPTHALVEHVLGHGCRDVISVALGGLLAQRRAARRRR